MGPFNDAWIFLKSRVESGMYRDTHIPDDPNEPVTKKPIQHEFGNRFSNIALMNALSKVGLPYLPETPIREGGAVTQPQADKIFGPGTHQYPNQKVVDELAGILQQPLSRVLGTGDIKAPNIGEKDGNVVIVDPSFLNFRFTPERAAFPPHVKEFVSTVPKAQLNALTNEVQDSRPMFDAWEDMGSDKAWNEGMGDYMDTRDGLTFLNSVVQDPAQQKLYEYDDTGGSNNTFYQNNMNRLRESLT